ncbi:hypothetical protein P376_2496 [Streptomyces sp. HCCB10043]|nr:hypothetical protein P376_2496 [Streptomyces sp. HCCB10043]
MLRQHRDDGRAVHPPGVRVRRGHRVHPVRGAQGVRHLRRVGAPGDVHVERGERAGGHPRVRQRGQPLPAGARFGEPVRGGHRQVEPQRGDRQDDQHPAGERRGQPAEPDDAFGDGRPEPSGGCLPLQAGPLPAGLPPLRQPTAGRTQQQGQQGQRDQGTGRGHHHPADAQAAEQRNRQQHHGDQADGDRPGREHDRVPGGGHRPPHRVVPVVALGLLLPPARHQDQRVVDGDPDPEERQHDHRRLVHRDEGARREQPEERDRHGDQRGQQRDEGQRGPEHVEQDHDRRADGDDQLHRHVETALVRSGGQGVEAGDPDLGARREFRPHRLRDQRTELRSLAERTARQTALFHGSAEDQTEGGPASLAEKRLVAGVGVRDHPGVHLLGGVREGPPDRLCRRGAVGALPLGEGDDGYERPLVAAVPVRFHDLLVCLVAGQPRVGVALVHVRDQQGDGSASGEQQQDDDHPYEPLPPKDEAAEFVHASRSPERSSVPHGAFLENSVNAGTPLGTAPQRATLGG